MTERWRFYLAGALHATGGVWLAGWALSRWVPSLDPLFGPQGWLPASLGLMLLTLSIPVVLWSQRSVAQPAASSAGLTPLTRSQQPPTTDDDRREYGPGMS